MTQTDDDGYPMPPLILGEKITAIAESQAIDEDFVAALKSKTEADLQGEYLHVTKRQELEEAIKELVKTVVLSECKNNPGDATFAGFRDAAKEAGRILKN
jgi:hypothetical protein